MAPMSGRERRRKVKMASPGKRGKLPKKKKRRKRIRKRKRRRKRIELKNLNYHQTKKTTKNLYVIIKCNLK